MFRLNDNYSVLTKNGFQKFDGIKKTIKDVGVICFLSDGTNITTTENHRFYVGKSKSGKIFRKISNISINNIIDGRKLLKKEIINIEKEYFDLVNVNNGNHYITSNVTSHNCAFIRQNIWNEFADGIFPSQSSLSFKKRIIISTSNGINHFSNLITTARKNNFDIVQTKFDKNYKIQHCYIKDIELDKINLDEQKLHLHLRFISQIIEILEENDCYNITWKKQKKGSNGYLNYEVDWRDVPRFKSNGERLDPEEFKQGVIAKDGLVYWNQNYEGAFIGSSYTLISADSLKDLTSIEYQEKRDNKLKIYEKPITGHRYIMGVDPAKDGSDAFAVQIIDTYNLEFVQVATAQLQIEYILMPEFLLEWAEYYNNAYIIIENNEGSGQSVADMLYNIYEYDNMYFDKKIGSKKKYPGFRTTTKSRKQILQTMKLFIENNRLKINDSKTISEFYQFILINNKYQADEGSHDDLVMSLALCFAPFLDTKNFEDIKLLISTIFDEEQENSEVNIDDMIIIGDFNDGVEDNDFKIKDSTMWNGYHIEEDGFY